ncbi:MAG TPA: hypothetical protein VMV23_11705 [Candidatus Nanopelagicaceae bacterium]|nr:hypothetical protein [Candidatus Nanopelagicaceae bacterium]
MTRYRGVHIVNPSLMGLMTDYRNRELRNVGRRRRATFAEGILERRTAAAVRLLRAGFRRS